MSAGIISTVTPHSLADHRTTRRRIESRGPAARELKSDRDAVVCRRQPAYAAFFVLTRNFGRHSWRRVRTRTLSESEHSEHRNPGFEAGFTSRRTSNAGPSSKLLTTSNAHYGSTTPTGPGGARCASKQRKREKLTNNDVLDLPVFIDVHDVMQTMKCSRAMAYGHMRAALGRGPGERGQLRVPVYVWHRYVRARFDREASQSRDAEQRERAPTGRTASGPILVTRPRTKPRSQTRPPDSR
jgi:hypothetical protein